MVSEEPKISDSARLPIGKAAKVLGISRFTLLNYAKNNLISFRLVQRKNSLAKVFLGKDIKKCWRTCI